MERYPKDKTVKQYRVQRAAASLPQTAQTAYFTVSGRVRILDIIGEVTTIIQNATNNMKLVANPTVGADVDLCAALDIDNDAVGTMYSITGDFSDAMIAITSGAIETDSMMEKRGIIVAAGTIDVACDASKTGATKWTVIYEPIDEGSYVVTA